LLIKLDNTCNVSSISEWEELLSIFSTRIPAGERYEMEFPEGAIMKPPVFYKSMGYQVSP
jgi:hypothetical protein